ncbi:MAG: hypothetical protein HOH38_07430 [Nitrospinaceae bacterium]|nr:hypothetical protein [Nitrospinaceae bacterium]MBT6345697.1 hypothetical protein [Nitrospina sp.]
MFKEKTVFVVGAGASSEYGLPVGIELANTIASLMRFEFDFGQLQEGDRKILNVLKHKFNNQNEPVNSHLQAARRISEGVTQTDSIDQYLYIHGDDEEAIFCGKAAVVRAILEAEKESNLYYDLTAHPQMIDFENLNNHWLKPFFTQLIAGRQKAHLNEIFRGITIICFNYDRCIEHYLIHALQKAYFIPPSEAAKLVSLLEIFYPYGKVGELKTDLNPNGVPFGADLNVDKFIQTVQGIRTYTEQVEDENSLVRIKRSITNANAIVFLGFAYHPQNMEILKPDNIKELTTNIFGTAYGISDHGTKEVANLTKTLTIGNIANIEINNKLKCEPFLKHFQLSL